MNITSIAKTATRQALAEAQDARAIVLDAIHLWDHNSRTMEDCARVFSQYSSEPTLVEWAASQTLLRGVVAVSDLLHRTTEKPDWLAEYEQYEQTISLDTMTVDEAMAILRGILGDDDAQA